MNRRGPKTRGQGVDPALRHTIRNQHRSALAAAVAGPPQIHPVPPAAEANGGLAHTKHRLGGERPFFNDWVWPLVDHQNQKIYSYGGVRPLDESNSPTADFHRLDVRTMQWQNLTDELRFRPRNYIFDPFRKASLDRRRLPALTESACTIITMDGGTFFLLFGGHDSDNPTADLIAVDLEDLIWWFVDIQGTPIRPRMSASMVATGHQIFIFGGRDRFDDDAPEIRTYSIAKYDPRTRWTWTVSDGPLPPDLPFLGYSIQATTVHDGQKILLTRGRIDDRPIDMSREATIFFHTQNHTFGNARETLGDFPRGIAWYQLGSVVAGAQVPIVADAQAPLTPRARGRRPKKPLPPTLPVIPNINVPAPIFPPSVVIVGWIKHSAGDDNLVPEVWQYLLPPTERIRCLNLRELIWDLELDIQAFVVVGNRLLLLGNEEEDGSAAAEDDQMLVDGAAPKWDVAIEISTQYLTEK
ncbi:hypothetical protein DFH07DRAFT_881336 [Mycena maculata]|uniref:Kelch repeat-containing protein n=1 Tax=Mycena maculata TaxID=230809 RepID=A0AAD7JME5_9AGAR|nr:hypothetical protein DFH07DRAFT_881336 [Mycena maculata]